MHFDSQLEISIIEDGGDGGSEISQQRRVRKATYVRDQILDRSDSSRFVLDTAELEGKSKRNRFSVYDNDSLQWLAKNYIW